MTEITQADREAAISGYFAWCSGNPVIPNKIASGVMDDHSMVQAFARHRMEERAAIVAMLEKDLKEHNIGQYHINVLHGLKYRIEAGEHLK